MEYLPMIAAAVVALSFFAAEGKAKKETLLFRVLFSCLFVLLPVVFLIAKGRIAAPLTFALPAFLAGKKLFLVYLGVLNALTFAAFGFDKLAAVRQRKRIRIGTLLGLSFLGGSLGGLLAMYVFRHKTQKSYFTVGIPAIIITQALVVFFWMNAR